MLEPGTPKTTLKQTPRGFNTLVIALVREYLVNSGIKRKYFLTFAIVKELQEKKSAYLSAYLSKGSNMNIWGHFLIGFLTMLNMVVASQTSKAEEI